MAGLSTEAKVGVFVMVALAMLAYMTFRLGKLTLGGPEGYEIWTVFDQVTGLKKGAPVEMAGIKVGSVERIELYNGKARVVLRIRPEVKVHADAVAVLRTRGILGDKYIALEGGSPAAPVLTKGQRLARARVPTDLDQVMAKIGEVASDIRAITRSLKASIGSPEGERNIRESLANIRELTSALKKLVAANRERMDRIISNFERFSRDLSELSAANKAALTRTIHNFASASAQLGQTMEGIRKLVAKLNSSQGSLGKLINDDTTVRELNATLRSLRQVMTKIEQGKGTLGRLVNDETTINKIDEALTSINDYLSRADAWQVGVTYRGEYLFGESAMRSTLNLRLQPKADKYYLIGIVSDPVGSRSELTTTTTTTEDGTTTTRTVHQVQTDKDSILFNAQIAKRIRDLTLRAGLIHSRGGFALDYHLLDDQLTLTMEAFDFRTDHNPHLKFAADLSFWKYFYITAGFDDPLSDTGHDSFFLGGGISFWDDDLKFLLTNAPKP